MTRHPLSARNSTGLLLAGAWWLSAAMAAPAPSAPAAAAPDPIGGPRLEVRVEPGALDAHQSKLLEACVSTALSAGKHAVLVSSSPDAVLQVEASRCESDPQGICAMSILALAPFDFARMENELVDEADCDANLAVQYMTVVLTPPYRVVGHTLRACTAGRLEQCCADLVADLARTVLPRVERTARFPQKRPAGTAPPAASPAPALAPSAVPPAQAAVPTAAPQPAGSTAPAQPPPATQAPTHSAAPPARPTAPSQPQAEAAPAVPPEFIKAQESCRPKLDVMWSTAWLHNRVTVTVTVENTCWRRFQNPTLGCQAFDSDGTRIGVSPPVREELSVEPNEKAKVVRTFEPAHGGVSKVTCTADW